jgi:hypothetical protein
LIDVRDESGEWAIDLTGERDENGALERDPEMDENPLLPAPEATTTLSSYLRKNSHNIEKMLRQSNSALSWL